MRTPTDPRGGHAAACCSAATRSASRIAFAAALLLAARADAQPATVPASRARYSVVVGDDWRTYRDHDALRAANRFWWFRREDVYRDVELVPDPVFGQVVRIRFRQSNETGFAPSMNHRFEPLDRAWFRWRMRFSPGWTSVGTAPAGYANSYKIAFWLWDGFEGRGELEYSNTDEYMPFWNVRRRMGDYLQYRKVHLSADQRFGRVSGEWSDGEWYEFVILYERTSPTTARNHWWRRRLTTGGTVVNNPWTYVAAAYSGAETPRVRAITLGGNRNRNNPHTMYIYWGPWEIVDGTRYPNPWNMPLRP